MITLSVPDMSCDHCVARIRAAVAAVDPLATVTTDLDAHLVTVETGAPPDALLGALAAAGYPATPA